MRRKWWQYLISIAIIVLSLFIIYFGRIKHFKMDKTVRIHKKRCR
ncbi:MAG: hypothetical protein P4M11_08965 [Candidatus Pacebacteria bacterium]|nr:hypothetical protein [Candidatus Paceibacterota bacterium]